MKRSLFALAFVLSGFAAGLVLTGRMRTADETAAATGAASQALPGGQAVRGSSVPAALPDLSGVEPRGLPVLPWADSSKLKVAEWVLAIGNPFQLNQTVTLGIVSALGRSLEGRLAMYEDFIQTDAAINPGNSGGALVNAQGELVGINTAIFSETGGYQGIGFAVPSNLARHGMDDLLKNGEGQRGTMPAVGSSSLNAQIAEQP